jgi:hypothetical protein
MFAFTLAFVELIRFFAGLQRNVVLLIQAKARIQ